MIINFSFRLFSILLLSLSVVYAQDSTLDHTESSSLKKASLFFKNQIKSQSRLFNGTAYLTYGSNVQGSAIFKDLSLINGKLIYDGITYDSIPLMYDIYIDKLVTATYGNKSLMSLINEKVSDFYINTHHFIYLNVNKNQEETKIFDGFFELLYSGKFRILAKNVKKLQFSTNADSPYYFDLKTTYFLERNNTYEEFSSESSFLNLFKDKKSEMKKHLQSSKVNFKNNPTESIVLLATYYEKLQN